MVMPSNPNNNPNIFDTELSANLGINIKANANVQMGTVPFKTPANPGDIKRSPQNKKVNGIACANNPITQSFQRKEN